MIDLKDWLKLQEDGLKACSNKRYVQAEIAFTESLKILKEQEKEVSSDIDLAIQKSIKEKMALSLNNLAAIYQLQGKYGLALNEYIKSTDIYRKIHGENSLDFASSLHNLGMVYAAKQDFQQAEALFRRSLAIKEGLLRATHPELQALKDNLAKVLEISGQRKRPEDQTLSQAP
jgi:tetratricopeptide (TPR) repeat protein